MRQIALLALLLAFAAAVYGQENILEKGLEGRSAADVISRRYVTPLRLVALLSLIHISEPTKPY